MRRFSLLLPVVALLAACGEEKPDTGLSPSQVDADGDGYTPLDGDCDDGDPAVHPGAEEQWYDGVDDDCDGRDDDQDGDGYGVETDCDDEDATVHPEADETCDGVDDDCDGQVDESAVDASTWWPDADGDGYGDDSAPESACESPSGYVHDHGEPDCDDSDEDIHPGADEWCNGVDDDCDDLVDDEEEDYVYGSTAWYPDGDGDGYGGGGEAVEQCEPPAGYGEGDEDCDDTDPGVYPGAAEEQDLVDQDCDTLVDEDFIEVGDLVIAEIMKTSDLASTCSCSAHDGDWFEVVNTSEASVRLDGWEVSQSDGSSFAVAPEAALVVEPGGLLVFCCMADFFAEPEVCDYAWSDDERGDGAFTETLVLDEEEDGLVLTLEGTVVDEVAWFEGEDADGYTWPREDTFSMSLDPGCQDATANDEASCWCNASEDDPYGDPELERYPNYGTPGSPNPDCP